MRHQSNLELAVGHLNASVGRVLTPEQLATALRAGSSRTVSSSPTAAALVSSLFVELAPELIFRCAAEADADVHRVNQLYRETLADALPRARAWENSVEHFL
ncbi:hypothetical protein XpopCFBP1817_18725 [Xanthomonas populi]|uniref:Uncharacterized protein n=1 Tax=Xanthomonas populi TaxID=53414 RepID=A0A2S7E9V0_9XANT|nr:hypothetical protein XpopCFBP1817_18725 [Xanthomonas populi]